MITVPVFFFGLCIDIPAATIPMNMTMGRIVFIIINCVPYQLFTDESAHFFPVAFRFHHDDDVGILALLADGHVSCGKLGVQLLGGEAEHAAADCINSEPDQTAKDDIAKDPTADMFVKMNVHRLIAGEVKCYNVAA